MTTFPENDDDFEVVTLTNVVQYVWGYALTRSDGFSYSLCLSDNPESVTPVVGQTARFYGRIGYPIRGLFLDGCKVFYRTPEEESAKRLCDTYGKDCADWLARWDAGKLVWSFSMGGFGPGYEQAIQIAAVELLRVCLRENFDTAKWTLDLWPEVQAALYEQTRPVWEKLGLSGAQLGAAIQLACFLYEHGPIALPRAGISNRLILICKNFPSLE